jgi:hypothetical protein
VLYAFVLVVWAELFVLQRRPLTLVLGLPVALLAGRGVARTRDQGHLRRPRLEDPLLATGAAVLVLILHRGLHLPTVLAAALGVVAGDLALRVMKGARDYHGAPWTSGAFVAMTAPSILAHDAWVLLAAALAGLLWSLSRDAWVGIGGKIGTVALAAVLVVRGVARLAGDHGVAPTLHAPHAWLVPLALLGAASASLTGWLAFSRGWGPLLGSAVPSALVAIALVGSGAGTSVVDVVALAWLCASFAGMSTPARRDRAVIFLPLAGALAAVLVAESGVGLAGVGGLAGAVALVVVFAVRGLGLSPAASSPTP